MMVAKDRINWIDWAKWVAITFVVFGHIPEIPDNFLMGYICTFHIPLFFVLSGYLAKKRTDWRANAKKHWHSLILPYILYNLLFYPYWLVWYKYSQGGSFTIFDTVVKPFCGVLFGQIPTAISCPLYGVMWFLAALLMMRILVNLCNRSRYSAWLLCGGSVIAVMLYVASVRYGIFHNLLMAGLLRGLPFYVLGHLLQRNGKFTSTAFWLNMRAAAVLYVISIGAYCCLRGMEDFSLRIILFYVVAFSGSFAVLCTCKLLDQYTSTTLVNLSVGTIVIMGLHWMYIGTTNLIVQKAFGIVGGVKYDWYVAVLLALLIEAAIYPIIVFSKKHLPVLLGK